MVKSFLKCNSIKVSNFYKIFLKLSFQKFFICSLIVFFFFLSICLILYNEANEHQRLYATYDEKVFPDFRDRLLYKFSEHEKEKIAKELIKQYSLHRTDRKLYGQRGNAWKIAESMVNKSHIFPPGKSSEIGYILHEMHTSVITKADVALKGTQLKLLLTLKGGQKVVFKPKWYDRDKVLEGTPYEGKDRHNAEVVAFHLSRILDMRRTPIAVGRIINLYKEVLPLATKRLKNTFFKKGDELCFLGKCLYCKTKEDAACAQAGMMEGVLILWLPSFVKFNKYKHPWRRSYDPHRKMIWEEELEKSDMTNINYLNDSPAMSDYCLRVVQNPLYNHTNLFYDLIDTCVFDFIMGNADRHHYEVFTDNLEVNVPRTKSIDADAFLVMLDNGKSLGNPYKDELSILAPLLQCNTIRKVTAMKLNRLKDGVIIRVLNAVITADPLPKPIITKNHLLAVSRRLDKVIEILSHKRIFFY